MRRLILPLFAVLALACNGSSSDTPDAGNPCVGGVMINGACEAKCDPSKCLANNICVDNKCALECSAHSQCNKYSQQCLPATEDDTGRQTFVCTDTPVMEYGDSCPNGDECPLCYSNGPGDARSYCTLDCTQDKDCPGGYECGYVRDPHQICGTQKGNNSLCGRTDEPCVDRSSLTPDGGLVESAFCLEKRICMKKDVCASCENDVDCSWTGTQCVQIGPNDKRCLLQCGQESDCDPDKTCFNGHCYPRYGACAGNEFCAECRYDTDCGAGFACISLHGNEKACIDMSFKTTCTTDADCPVAPSGLHGACLTEAYGVDQTSGAYHRCYAPHFGQFFSCY